MKQAHISFEAKITRDLLVAIGTFAAIGAFVAIGTFVANGFFVAIGTFEAIWNKICKKFHQSTVILFQDFKLRFRVHLLTDKNILPPEFENFATDTHNNLSIT